MAYDEALAERIRDLLTRRSDVAERRMFGGLCFLVGGHMACGIVGDELMVRVGPEAYEDRLARPHARVMDFTGRISKNMVYVGIQGFETAEALEDWVGAGVAFAGSLPPK